MTTDSALFLDHFLIVGLINMKKKPDIRISSFLVVREIDGGDWLARGYMPAHPYCDLFYPLGGDMIGVAKN